MAIFTAIGFTVTFLWLTILICGGRVKVEIDNPIPKLKKLFSK